MASIISTGIGSGLDISGLVQQLVAAEAAPVETRLATNEARAQSKLSAFGSMKSVLSAFRDQVDEMRKLDSLQARKGISANEDRFTVSVTNDAAPASYAVDVGVISGFERAEPPYPHGMGSGSSWP